MPDSQKLTIYEQLCNSYRAIDDFRAKLLGYLPLATGTGIFLLLGLKIDVVETLSPGTKIILVAVGVFGFFVTLGLFSYEIYEIKKCACLITTGRDIEDVLGLDGQFKSRPQNVLRVINEPFAAGVIYPAVLAAWTFFALIFAWPSANPWVPIFVFIVGFASTLIYDFRLRNAYKHKLLLDENLPPRQFFSRLNERFDVKHIKHDLHQAGVDDGTIYELAVREGRIILTINVRDFRALLREDTSGVIGVPEKWSVESLDTKLAALLTRYGPKHFRGRYIPLAGLEDS